MAAKTILVRGKYDRRRESPAYWDARLKRMGLTMDAGYNPNWLSYGHEVLDLDFDGRRVYSGEKTIGERLIEDEWPVSLL